MRLLVYNIAYGTGSPGSYWEYITGAAKYLRTPERYFNAIAHLVRHKKPDVAGFLETDNGSFRTGGISQVSALAKLLSVPLNGNFSSKYAPNSYLARLPYCRHQTNVLFVRNGNAERENACFMPCGAKRLILTCTYNNIDILLVHLALTAKVRKKQLEYLSELISRGRKTVVCGDFNTFAGCSELDIFMKSNNLQSANVNSHPTYPARKPVKELDYILYSPELQLKEFKVLRFPGSDHLPLYAEFE